ncbi:P-loop containing nucleoside triphosphate hydrolase protein [Amylostereum chailletii]|nr:P-loop containing nucleoside triphosphate hydrolase protein [Amylostereum chailletii]
MTTLPWSETRTSPHMLKDFPRTKQIFLEQNYRSTASILDLSIALISQDKSRVQKTLHTDHPMGPRPMLCCVQSEHAEALLIAAEIKRLVAGSGVRFNALSRNIEAALQIQGIPNRVLKGAKFFERAEVKDLLSYMQIVDNGKYLPAFMRTVNLPHRGLGEKSVAQIVARAEQERLSPLDVVERIYDGKMPDNKPGIRKKIASYVKIIRTLRKYANKGMGPADILRRLIKISGYREYLSKKPDHDMREENVDELITFATEQQGGLEHVEAFHVRTGAVEDADPSSAEGTKPRNRKTGSSTMLAPEFEVIEISDDDDDDDNDQRSALIRSKSLQPTDPKIEKVTLPRRSLSDKAKGKQKAEDVEPDDGPADKTKVTPLRAFLEASMLSTDTGGSGDEESKDKVTISTCHSAKGLEWPVVFVPAVETDIFPFKRAEDVAEERYS